MKSFPADKKGILIFLSLFFIGSFYNAQRHELGVRLGMSNLVGDIGRTTFILQKPFGGRVADHGIPFYGGIMYRMNFNPYQTLRFDLGYSHIQFSDPHAKEQYRVNRGISGTNSGVEFDAMFEYNFYPVNNEQKGMLSPYIFGGIGGIVYSNRQVTLDFTDYPFTDADNDGTIDNMPVYPVHYSDINGDSRAKEDFNKAAYFSIPFGAGLKYKFNYNWALFGEFKFRYTFTDNIDYSNLAAKDVKVTYDKELPVFANRDKGRMTTDEISEIATPYYENQQFGNPNSNDWINTVSLGVSYSFGRPPCYCD